jgi:hypothetical protein
MPRLVYTPRDSRNPQVGRKALAAGADGFDGSFDVRNDVR